MSPCAMALVMFIATAVGLVAVWTILTLFIYIVNIFSRNLLPVARHVLPQFILGLGYLFAGPDIIEEAYIKSQGKPFFIKTPSNNHLLVSSKTLIAEITEAPPDGLSLHAMAKEMLQPKYTMQGFEWQDQRGVEGTGFVRALRSRLTSNLPRLRPDLERLLRSSLDEELSSARSSDGSSHVKLFPMTKRLVTRINCFVFFGEELSNNKEFTAAALEFPQTVMVTAELLRLTPGLLRPFIASLVSGGNKAAKTLFQYLQPVVSARLAIRAQEFESGKEPSAPVDCMQWLIETSPRKNPWSPARMIGEIMAIWFSSVHQLAMTLTFVLHDICLHPEYVQPLRNEIRTHWTKCIQEGSSFDVEKLPLLDSFVKESIRHSNADAVTCRRKALKDYVLSDGSRVAKGNWVCIPQRAMMHDPARYADPTAFDGFRFAEANMALGRGQATNRVPDEKPSTLTAANLDWPIWGLGTKACPGRFYASLVLKLTTALILDGWDCIITTRTTSSGVFYWRSSIVPREDMVVTFSRQRAADPRYEEILVV